MKKIVTACVLSVFCVSASSHEVVGMERVSSDASSNLMTINAEKVRIYNFVQPVKSLEIPDENLSPDRIKYMSPDSKKRAIHRLKRQLDALEAISRLSSEQVDTNISIIGSPILRSPETSNGSSGSDGGRISPEISDGSRVFDESTRAGSESDDPLNGDIDVDAMSREASTKREVVTTPASSGSDKISSSSVVQRAVQPLKPVKVPVRHSPSSSSSVEPKGVDVVVVLKRPVMVPSSSAGFVATSSSSSSPTNAGQGSGRRGTITQYFEHADGRLGTGGSPVKPRKPADLKETNAVRVDLFDTGHASIWQDDRRVLAADKSLQHVVLPKALKTFDEIGNISNHIVTAFISEDVLHHFDPSDTTKTSCPARLRTMLGTRYTRGVTALVIPNNLNTETLKAQLTALENNPEYSKVSVIVCEEPHNWQQLTQLRDMFLRAGNVAYIIYRDKEFDYAAAFYYSDKAAFQWHLGCKIPLVRIFGPKTK